MTPRKTASPSRSSSTARKRSAAGRLRSLRADLAAVHRIAVLEGWHEGTWNHFSARVPGRANRLLLTPGRTHFSRVQASNLLLVDAKGRVVEGSGTPNISAWAIHRAIYLARPDVGCALHAHPPYATALSCLEGWRMQVRAGQDAAKFYRRVAYYDYRGTVTAEEEGDEIAAALGDHRALIMANHGVLVVGTTIEEAVLYLLVLERACRTELLALSTGRAIGRIPKRVARAVSDGEPGFGELGYLDAMKDVLDHRGEDYAT